MHTKTHAALAELRAGVVRDAMSGLAAHCSDLTEALWSAVEMCRDLMEELQRVCFVLVCIIVCYAVFIIAGWVLGVLTRVNTLLATFRA